MTIDWKEIEKDGLPEYVGIYLVVRATSDEQRYQEHGGYYIFEIGTCGFSPYRKEYPWYDKGFLYTHWYGPISKPNVKKYEKRIV